jgi:high-affinity nickel-transport protein
MDTADGVFMTRAYGWAFSTPLRKLYYNLTVTGLSVLAAWFIGGIELLQVLGEKFDFQGPLWDWVRNLQLGGLGYVLIGLFVLTWAVSYSVWKVGRLEERWGTGR